MTFFVSPPFSGCGVNSMEEARDIECLVARSTTVFAGKVTESH